MRKALLVSAVAGLALAAGFVATPAWAEDTDTTVNVEAEDGLTIAVPATATIGTGGIPGASQTGQLGAVTVTDARALLTTSWVASVVATDFTTGGATTVETIPAEDISYWSGAATAGSGPGTRVPGELLVTDAEVIATTQTAFSLTGGSGNNSVTWNPTLIIAVPATNIGGAYTGTVTHTVV